MGDKARLPGGKTRVPAEAQAVAPPPVPLRRPLQDEVAAAARAQRQPGAILLLDGPALWSGPFWAAVLLTLTPG